VRNWLETTDWDKESAPPTPTAEIVELASARYLEIYERLTGSPLI
jgi:phosphoribosylaminoimidazole-succinocarboxamide synthase